MRLMGGKICTDFTLSSDLFKESRSLSVLSGKISSPNTILIPRISHNVAVTKNDEMVFMCLGQYKFLN